VLKCATQDICGCRHAAAAAAAAAATADAAAVHCTATGQIIVKRILTWAHVKSCEKNTNEEDFLSFRFLNLTFVSCATKEMASLKLSFFSSCQGVKINLNLNFDQ
jgi:hypothetical protein